MSAPLFLVLRKIEPNTFVPNTSVTPATQFAWLLQIMWTPVTSARTAHNILQDISICKTTLMMFTSAYIVLNQQQGLSVVPRNLGNTKSSITRAVFVPNSLKIVLRCNNTSLRTTLVNFVD
eukprot:TRINITY_DN11652_c0_g1_i1.p2 TRINITY_DN11652_c0_g1~~TRINITY_DN11652_c0_g1_i1.p2  ORF type:complete len:121 (-),score=11.92 TRINITY_DN11652_c0_g1_i1:223-585(-)